jgi:glycerophosphoryl diester phosphodiesterase
MLLLGHRGASRYAPENTAAAFDLALEHGCDGFEFDVRATADGQAVICHDSRFCGQAITHTTYARLSELSSELLTFEQVLAQFSSRAYLYIELKVEHLEDSVLAALKAHPPERGYVVASFDPAILKAVHAKDAAIPLGFICRDRRKLDSWRSLPVGIVMPQCRLATARLVQAVHEAGKQIFAWTVNHQSGMQALAGLGVDGMLSDDTELSGRAFGRR